MGASVRRSLERIALLARGLALLLGLVVAGQVYARSGDARLASLAGVAGGAGLWLLVELALRRYRRVVEAYPEEPPLPPPRRPKPRPSPRLLSDRDREGP